MVWGGNSYGQLAIPDDARQGVIAVAAGLAHSLALRSDGRVVAWGSNFSGETIVPPSATFGIRAISAGASTSFAIKSDGTVVGWGYNNAGQITGTRPLTLPDSAVADPVTLNGVVLDHVAAISTQSDFTTALKDDGSAVAWGNNSRTQSDIPDTANSGVAEIKVGSTYTLARRSDGSVIAWGVTENNQRPIPLVVQGNAVSIAAAPEFALAVLGTAATIPTGPAEQSINFAPLAPLSYSAGLSVPLSATASSGLPVSFSILFGQATLSNNTLSVTGTGVVVIAANQIGSSAYSTATTVIQTLAVSRAPQTLSFGPMDPVVYAAGKTVALNAVSSAGQTVNYGVVSGPATVAGNLLTIQGVGTVILVASQAGNDLYLPAAPISQSLIVSAAPQAITFAALAPLNYSTGLSVPLFATASSGLPVSFSVASGPATLSDNTLIVTGTGLVVISANQIGSATYSPAPTVTQALQVNRGSQMISFGGLATVEFAPQLKIPLNASSSGGLHITYSVASGPASVAGNQLTISGAGTVVVTANQAGDGNFAAAAPVMQSLQVDRGRQTIIFPAPSALDYFDGETVSLAATSSSGLPVTLTVVSGPGGLSGTLLGVHGVGSIVISASQAGDGNFLPATTVTQTIVVNPRGQMITFAQPTTVTYEANKVVPLEATASSGLPVSFALISGPGTLNGNQLTLTGAGTLQITARQPGDATFATADPVTRTLIVAKGTQTIHFEPLDRQPLGGPLLTLSASASSGLPVAFTLTTGPAVLNGNQVRSTGIGTVQVTANQPGDDNYQSAPGVSQSFDVIPGLAVKLPGTGSTGSSALEIVVSAGMNVVVEETSDLGEWFSLGQFVGLGPDQPVIIPLGAPSTASATRFWRVRVIP